MNRLVVNPDTPQAWEINLKPGTNRIGRSAENDFQINDPSVSSSHCHILVNDGLVTIKDLNSTNGTFINLEPVQEATLKAGQSLKFGSVELKYYPDPAAQTEVKVNRPVALRINTHANVATAETPVIPPIIPTAVDNFSAGPRFCKFHPKSPAAFLCHKCNRTFCELCVSPRNIGGEVKKMCRSCGVECESLQFEMTHSAARGFFASLPGAFIYPFRGAGVLVLVFAAILFGALNFASAAGIFGLVIRVTLYGMIFLFMQNIIFTTTSNETETLGFPDMSDLGSAAFQLVGTILAAFWLAIGLVIAKFFDVDVPVEAIIGAVILGGIYFPMAFLAVAMKDTVLAANPLVVIPAMLKKPLHYAVTVGLLLSVFGFRQLGDILSSGAGSLAFSTTETKVLLMAIGFKVIWGFASIFLLTVTMRILGLFYNASKEELGWFNH